MDLLELVLHSRGHPEPRKVMRNAERWGALHQVSDGSETCARGCEHGCVQHAYRGTLRAGIEAKLDLSRGRLAAQL